MEFKKEGSDALEGWNCKFEGQEIPGQPGVCNVGSGYV